MKKIVGLLTVLLLIVVLFSPLESAHAEKIIVKWGKITLKEGHIGKVIINKDTPLYKFDKENKLTTVRTLKKGEEYGVYSKKTDKTHGILYGLGSSQFVKDSKSITYQTPSKEKKELVGKERIWLRNPDFYENNKGEIVDLKNLQEAILISSEKNPELSTLNIKIKIEDKYFTYQYVDETFIEASYITKNPFNTFKFSDTMWNLIKNEKVQTGMTMEQVLLSWGYPDDVNSYDSDYIALEQWVYGDILDGAAIYLYFDNGIVTSWQEF
ncbi:hypothetical protein LIS82_22385 [Cytobacillus solani]|uniref:Uncharacterized protein n=1 Tax=Cytobacillus solani TaxID=1637975 RepID=A0A0Q3QS94_9BACI|nr:hypothetical protein [Cytobacillus solani]KOP84086.1 hypothetical protein AMS60_00055 [Bacillus sp. FJAT-21945]KQL21025.1 hypothetical protein AN957_22260 [Cytobacillus solani]USK54273.1 hypothetical protein LIS82_22385 [Cytobacillus solani]